MKKVLVFEGMTQSVVTYLESNHIEVIINKQQEASDFTSHPDIDGIILMMHPVAENIMSKLPKLKVIARFGVGYDNVNLEDASSHHIVVTNTPGANATAVAETAVMHMLMAGRSFYQQRQSITDNIGHVPVGQEITGKTIGIIGFGAIGQKIDELLTGFNVNVLAYARHEKSVKNGRMATLEDIYTKSDFIVLALPSTPETHHMINADVFEKMKTNAVLVNIARGSVVDEQALITALKSGKIAGAGLDVVENEPIANNNELLTLPNVFVTPHVAAKSREAFDSVGFVAAQEVVRVLNNDTPHFKVND